MIWRKGETPPGFVPPDVRTRTAAVAACATCSRGSVRAGLAVRSGAASRARQGTAGHVRTHGACSVSVGRSRRTEARRVGEVVKGRGGQRPQGGATPETKESGREPAPGWWRPPADRPSGGGDKAKDSPRTQPKERPRDESKPPPSDPPPSDPSPSRPPPRDDGGSRPPPSSPPPRNDGGYRPPPSNPPPRWNPPPSRPSPPGWPRGQGRRHRLATV
jgi:hypothetical protein